MTIQLISTKGRLRRKALLCIGASSLLMLTPLAGFAQAAHDYPSKPIRLVVAFAPGGPTDVLARLVAEGLSKRLGQSVVVENKPGAGGNVASAQISTSPADGYTLLYNSSSISISPVLLNNQKLDPNKIFTPIAPVATVPLALIVNPSVPASNVQEFVELLKKEPKNLNMGSSGNGTIDHLTSELFARQTGTECTHIPYRGNAVAIPDLLAGRIDFMMSGSFNAFLPFIQEGKLKALAVTTEQRVDVLPDVPTLAETVAPGFNSGTWQGIVAPHGLPTEIQATLNRAVNEVIADPELQQRFKAQGAQVTGGTAQAYGELISSEYARWTTVIQETGVTFD